MTTAEALLQEEPYSDQCSEAAEEEVAEASEARSEEVVPVEADLHPTGKTPTPKDILKIREQKMTIHIINGPNLNLLGTREPGIYGSSTFEDYLEKLRQRYSSINIQYYQSNVEGLLIDRLQQVGFSADGIILNAGAYTHTSIALQDCIRSLTAPVIEVHISNVHKREEFRHHSMISCACKGVICGFGLDSYRLAIEALI